MPRVALPDVVTQIGGSRGQPRAPRRLFFDVKTIHGGTEFYYTQWAEREQAGAVHAREVRVWADYQRHARELDSRFSPAGTQPILQRLQSFGRTRGLVFGAYGEASADVHDLLAASATALADDMWREAGARTASEMRAVLISRMRRRMGLAVVQAMARHRIARVPFVGASRATIQARAQRVARQQRQRGAAWVHEAQDIYIDLARQQGGLGAAWAV
jgi:hypothetical protein